MIKAIFFDFDGTLADTAPGIVKTMVQTFTDMGVAIPKEEDMLATIGLRLDLALQKLGNFNDEKAQEAAAIYRKNFPNFELGYITIFPKVKETLAVLKSKNIRMAVVTSRGANSLDTICERHGIKEFFETRVTYNDNLAPKPAPDMVLALLERMNLQKDEVLVVGDTTFDIEMGNRAGCKTVAVTYGNHSLQKLLEAKPTYIIDNFDEIEQYI